MSGYTRTAEQHAVIAHALEPLRVAAGAGTGKTATVTDRLVDIIESGTPPEAALGITFTNKAAEELSDRLRSELPGLAAQGREVEVTTYHGFAYALLQEFGALVGVERDAEVIGPGYVRQLLFESLSGGTYHELDLTAPTHRVNEAATLSGQLGENLMSAADLLAAAAGHTEDPWPARRELAGIIDRYEKVKQDLGAVDYADLIAQAHRLVAEHPVVTKRIRDRYVCVVLDEYQDTAPAQREVLRLIFSDGFPVTAVGDGDQTIYEWRGASQENFRAFPHHLRPRSDTEATTLALTVNHRSATRILDVAHEVRKEIHPSGDFARLTADGAAPDGRANARWFRTAVDEATWIAQETERLHVEEGVAWGDIAVLFRKNRQISLVKDACTLAGIPVEVASLGGLLDVPEVADMLAWLRILHHRDDTVALARVLMGSRYRLGLGDLAPLVQWGRKQGLWTEDDEGPTWPLLEAVDRVDEIEGIAAEPRRRVAAFRDLYRSLITEAQGLALVELCRRILDAMEAWEEVEAIEPAAALSARLNLYRFLDLAQEWSPLRGRPSLDAFLGYLDVLQTDPAADELDTARVGGNDAVAMLTVHRAKGLEWEAVFLPALAEGIFPARSLGYDNPAAHARYLPYDLRLDADTYADAGFTDADHDAALRSRHLTGEWRTAYVAVTRAKRRLYVTGAYWYGGKRPKQPSRLFQIAQECAAVDSFSFATEPGDRPDHLGFSESGMVPDPLFADGWRSSLSRAITDPGWPASVAEDPAAYDAAVDQLRILVDGLPEDVASEADQGVAATSVTGLVTLAGCPLRFYWSEVDRLPRRPSPALQRGVELHRRIELHNRGAIAFENLDEGLYDTPGDGRGEPLSTGDPFETFLTSRFADRTPRFVETPIDLRLGVTRVRGRIDAVYVDEDDSWEIVDYKSGRDRGATSAVVQLEAYAIAARDGAIAANPPQDLTVTFLYLGESAAHEVSHTADEAWLGAADRHLNELAAAVSGETFAATPSAACSHCDFLKFCEAGRGFLEGG